MNTHVHFLLYLAKFFSEWEMFQTNFVGKVKVKVKFSLEQATKAQRGRRCIAVLFL